jgi:hypothetical protein
MPSASTRKAPSDSATLFKRGTVKKGNDGNKWIIVADARGVQRWRKINATTTTTRKNRSLKQRRHKSARLLAMEADPDTVWGKNKPLENFWNDLASGRKVVLIKKNGEYEMFSMPKSTHDYLSEEHANQYDKFDKNPNIVAVLTSYRSQDAYELHLYPKAKDATVEYVIKHYKKFFPTKVKNAYMP